SFVFENNDDDVMDNDSDSNLSSFSSSSSSLGEGEGRAETDINATSKTTTTPMLIDLLVLTEEEDEEDHKEEKQEKKKIEKQQNRARTDDNDDDTTRGSSSSDGRCVFRAITLMNCLTEECWTELMAVTSRWSPSTQHKHAWTLAIGEAHCTHHQCLPALPLNLQRHNVGAFVQWLILDVGYANNCAKTLVCWMMSCISSYPLQMDW
ncbi:hypothetical protein QOT17_001671, partial [Balamuthia mandrillaris]